jgi:hypothetical protein
MIANGTMKTINDEEDIYISLTQLCDYFTQSSINLKKELKEVNSDYGRGLIDMMFTISQELLELGKFEAQRRLINSPQDLLNIIDKNPFGKIE